MSAFSLDAKRYARSPRALFYLILGLALIALGFSLFMSISIIHELGEDASQKVIVSVFYEGVKSVFSGLSSLAFILLWYQALKEMWKLQDEEQLSRTTDYGLFYLSMAVLCWAYAGCVGLVEISTMGNDYHGLEKEYEIIYVFLSSANNLFVLLTVATFRFEEKEGVKKEPYWYRWPWLQRWREKKWIYGGFLLVVVSSILLSYLLEEDSVTANWKVLPDFLFSNCTALLLFGYLWYGLPARGLDTLTPFLFFTIILTVFAQSFFFFANFWIGLITTSGVQLLLFTYTAALIVIFQALASSWKDFEKNIILERRKRLLNQKIETLRQLQEDLVAEVTQKARLTRSMNHAIRGSLNNLMRELNVIIRQQREKMNEEQLEQLIEVKDRVANIYLLHDYMHEQNTDQVNLKTQFERLVQYFKGSHQYTDSELVARFEISKIITTPSKARELSTVVLEFFINANKAFVGQGIVDRLLHIDVQTIIVDRKEFLSMTVKDNGPGIHKDFRKGYGFRYIEIVVETFSGKFYEPVINESGGTTFKIEIPLNKLEALTKLQLDTATEKSIS